MAVSRIKNYVNFLGKLINTNKMHNDDKDERFFVKVDSIK